MATPNQHHRVARHLLFSALIGIQLVVPWVFAGALSRTQGIVSWCVAALVLATLACSIEITRRVHPVMMLVMGGVMLGGLQLVPLPQPVAHWVALGATAWRQQQGAVNVEEGVTDDFSLTRSIYPPDTRKGVAQLVVLAGVLWLALVLADSKRMQWLMASAAAGGAMISLFGIVQKFQWNGKLFWVIELSQGGAPFGPFVNRNNAGGYLCVCLAATIGLLLRPGAVFARGLGLAHGVGTVAEARPRPAGDRNVTAELATIVAFILICAGIMTSGSRGASLSLVTGLIVTWIVAVRATRALSAVARVAGTAAAVGLVMATVGFLSWLGSASETAERWQRAIDGAEVNGRWLNWQESLEALDQFLGLGSGMSTYRFVGLPAQARWVDAWYRHAENVFVQTLLDVGVVGLAMLVAAIVLLALAARRLLGRRELGIGLMATFLLVSQGISWSFDFGNYVLANGLLVALLVGGILRDDDHDEPSGANAAQRSGWMRWLGFALLTPLIAGGVELVRAGQVERHTTAGVARQLADVRLIELLNPRILKLSESLARRWDDGEGHFLLAQMYLHRYRLQVFADSATQTPWLSEGERWARSDVWSQLRLFQGLDAGGRERFRQLAAAHGDLITAAAHLQRARDYCPWLPAPHLWIPMTAALQGEELSDVDLACERAQRFGSGRPEIWFWSGFLRKLDGDLVGSLADWHRCLSMSGRFDSLIVESTNDVGVSELFEGLLGNAPELADGWASVMARNGSAERAAELRALAGLASSP